MSEIDWSKAPEGATHYFSAGGYFARLQQGSDHWWMIWNHSGWSEYGSIKNKLQLVERPRSDIPWSGEGLPPVGTVCEFQHRNAPDGKWHPTTIRYSSHAFVVYVDSIHEVEECWRVSDSCAINFRPARTAEQIAAEERETGAMQIMGIIEGERSDAKATYALYDAGYRKQEPE